MNEQDLLNAGYHKYTQPKAMKYEDYYYGKSIKDDVGHKYQILVYVYDWTKYTGHIGEKVSFMPVLYLHGKEEEPQSFDVEITMNIDSSIVILETIEKYCHDAWCDHGMVYAKKWDKE